MMGAAAAGVEPPAIGPGLVAASSPAAARGPTAVDAADCSGFACAARHVGSANGVAAGSWEKYAATSFAFSV